MKKKIVNNDTYILVKGKYHYLLCKECELVSECNKDDIICFSKSDQIWKKYYDGIENEYNIVNNEEIVMPIIKSSVTVETIEEKFSYPIILRCVYDSMLIVLFYEKRNGIVLSIGNQCGANGGDIYIGKCLKNENMDEWEPTLPGTKIVLE